MKVLGMIYRQEVFRISSLQMHMFTVVDTLSTLQLLTETNLSLHI